MGCRAADEVTEVAGDNLGRRFGQTGVDEHAFEEIAGEVGTRDVAAGLAGQFGVVVGEGQAGMPLIS